MNLARTYTDYQIFGLCVQYITPVIVVNLVRFYAYRVADRYEAKRNRRKRIVQRKAERVSGNGGRIEARSSH